MAQTIAIPGRRVNAGETFYTDWVPRGGDCILFRAQALVAYRPGGASVIFTLETRGEDGTTVTTITSTGGDVEMTAVGVGTALYLATTSTSVGNGAQEQVRVKIVVGTDEGDADYFVVRVFPLIFFDSAKPY